MRELRPLRLPRMVEEDRKRREDARHGSDSPESGPVEYALHHSFSSTSSDNHSPVTPTFSLRGHMRFSSSSSSLSSSPTLRESIEGFAASKRPLTEVKEEPQERDEDVEMTEAKEDDDCDGIDYEEVLTMGTRHADGYGLPSPSADYDWVESPSCEADFDPIPASKRRRADESMLDGMTSRLGTRFPSLSRKWKNRRDGKSTSIVDAFPEALATRSRANSTRAPSFIDSLVDAAERHDQHVLLTPRRSFSADSGRVGLNSSPVSPIDIEKANASFHEEEDASENPATTPLLPPVMAQFASAIDDGPVQSPLQSPKIADSPTVIQCSSPASGFVGLPSPPLSTRPSVSSFHRRPLLPASDIPPILLADPQDEWANKLGHANFTIYPEPYLPDVFDLTTCKQFRTDWETARCNFTKHLARTGEHYSTTSKVHQLTEEKWAQVDAMWKRNNELTLSRTAERDEGGAALSQQASIKQEPPPLMKIPCFNGPRSEGKFPKVGEVGIVGPMVQDKPMPQQRPSRKRAFWKFLQGVLPGAVAFGRAAA